VNQPDYLWTVPCGVGCQVSERWRIPAAWVYPSFDHREPWGHYKVKTPDGSWIRIAGKEMELITKDTNPEGVRDMAMALNPGGRKCVLELTMNGGQVTRRILCDGFEIYHGQPGGTMTVKATVQGDWMVEDMEAPLSGICGAFGWQEVLTLRGRNLNVNQVQVVGGEQPTSASPTSVVISGNTFNGVAAPTVSVSGFKQPEAEKAAEPCPKHWINPANNRCPDCGKVGP
jgi:hypothetical protein